jgi:bifunctional non-homologous end joining protein LigD
MIVDEHTIRITHPTKEMFPGEGVTKQDIATYYAAVAPYMLPHIKDRPLVLTRYIEGIGGEGFYQKEAGSYFPKWIQRASVKLVQGGTQHLVVADSAATLVYLANQGTITFHVWSSTVHALHKPDEMVFDLDPSDNDFPKVIAAAQLLRQTLQTHGYEPHLMLTGSRGLHVLVHIKPTRDFDTVRNEARGIAGEVIAQAPELVTIEARKAKRKKRLYIDITRNAYGQTHVAPFSLRARSGAPVAMPLAWDELTGSVSPKQYTIHNTLRRLSHTSDPWETA